VALGHWRTAGAAAEPQALAEQEAQPPQAPQQHLQSRSSCLQSSCRAVTEQEEPTALRCDGMAAADTPLRGLRVLEIAGLAPAPFAGMVLADFGADVVRIDRVERDGSVSMSADTLARGKRSIGLDLKAAEGRALLVQLARRADVLIEPFRPGVMERLGLGPEVLLAANPRLVYARMTGFGQGGDEKVEKAAGHDINYLAQSGVLSALRREGERPLPPVNLLGDFAGGGMMCAMGVLLALLERQKSGKGQIVDAAMVDGVPYVSSFVYKAWGFGQYRNELAGVGTNLLDTGAHFYDTYTCKCGGHFSVGAIEPQFYKLLLDGLGLDQKRDRLPKQSDRSQWKAMRARFAQVFLTKTRDEWAAVFYGTDACAFPVLSLAEAQADKHNKLRGTFAPSGDLPDSMLEPLPAPKLSRTPGLQPRPSPQPGAATDDVLKEYGWSQDEIERLASANVIGRSKL
jgi:alpha-methylacyl-CoA racemase